uniref:RIMS-binding protein 2 n=1 Tax=Anas platyrhynchos TaxID=8839 RepID=A0A8B9TNT2_ANAPL
FSLLSQELKQFRLQTGKIDLLTSTLVTSELPLALCSSSPQLHWEKGNCWRCLACGCFDKCVIICVSGKVLFCDYFSYNPFDGPNENPEAELPLTAGEYIYIYGDMDEDGFFEGELMDGRRGLVPSNFVERISDDDLMTFLPSELNDLTHSSYQEKSFVSASTSSGDKSDFSIEESSISPLASRAEGDQEEAVSHTAVPYPRKLTLIKQLARSIVVGWEPPLLPTGCPDIQSYNIYVDEELRQNVKSGFQTKTVIEKLDLKTKAYRVSVQSVTEQGSSDKLRCTFFVGQDFCLAPTMLKVRSVTATSAEVTWLPCNSNYNHAVYLNGEECDITKPGVYWYAFRNLQPSTQYVAKLEARPLKTPWEEVPEGQEQNSAVIHFTTPLAGTPDAPLDVQVEAGPSPGILVISWLPVTIDAEGSSNGVRVTGYAVYADWTEGMELILCKADVCAGGWLEAGAGSTGATSEIKVKYYFIAEIERMPERIEIGFVFPQQEEKLSEIGRRQLTLFAEHNRSSDLSDILEEEEEDELSSEALEEKKWDSREPFYRENGEKVTCSRVMLVGSASPPRSAASATAVKDDGIRIFVALFDYDPVSMSPNPDAAEEELPFKEGQILKVCGDKDADGFYRGECAGREGYIPCNMVSEIQVENNEIKRQLLKQGFLPADTPMESIGTVSPLSELLTPRSMMAVFDYNPKESSPNADAEAELTFSAGDIITVFGSMDDDGFYYVSIGVGWVLCLPSSFLPLHSCVFAF